MNKYLVDVNEVGYDNEYLGVDGCCAKTLAATEALPQGVVVVCEGCGDAWASQTKSNGEPVWFRTLAGKYSDDVREKLVAAQKHERGIKRKIIVILAVLALFVIGWSIGDYHNEEDAVEKIVVSSAIVLLVGTAASFALFGSMFKRLSRHSKKLRYEIQTDPVE